MAIDGKGRPTKEQAKKAKTLQTWLNAISGYEREFKTWEGRVEKIIKRYRDDRVTMGGDTSQARFNILWSNIQTLIPATFSRLPQPDVSRRFRDNDPVGRVASLILERALEFEISHYPDYRATITQSISDRFLGGRGTAWARYEPHITSVKKQLPEDGVQVTGDTDEPEEELEYECAPIDYVHWRDFGHSVARTWEEVTKVWRKVYMTRDACVERFGDVGKEIPLDSTPEDLKTQKDVESEQLSRALIYEGWDKESGTAVWISKSMKKILDEKDNPLNLEGFFPCPKPIFATITNESLIPVPDFTLYQDQAKELDTLADRIDGLVKALQVKGCYDASIPELARLFTEGQNGDMIPVKNWGAFAEKQGLDGAINLVDLKPLAEALREAYQAMEQIKSQVYEITGISDIIRGTTQASETATAQQIKGKYATLRLKSYQDEVAMYATECLRLKAQIMCGKFDPQTLIKISAVDQLSPVDQQYVEPALALLFGERLQNPDAGMGHYDNPVRSFRIEIAADTLIQIDEEEEKNQRMEFLRATGAFLKEATTAGQTAPQMVPLLMEMLKFGVTGFKVGKTIEGAFDEAEAQAKQMLANPQQKQDPEMAKVQGQQAHEQARLQHDQQVAGQQAQMEQARLQMEAQNRQKELEMEAQKTLAEQNHAAQMDEAKRQHEAMMEQMRLESQQSFDRWKAELDSATKITIAEISAKASMDQALVAAESAANKEVNEELGDNGDTAEQANKSAVKKTARRAKPIDRLVEMHQQQMDAHQKSLETHGKTVEAITELAKAVGKPKTVLRGPDGRVSGVQ